MRKDHFMYYWILEVNLISLANFYYCVAYNNAERIRYKLEWNV